ncbi:MAG TPA: hypothetical protein VKG45_00115 [Actinomycetes bacterium]|nr:hypothetical protein [Actinomycetes bacterium]
MPARPAGLPSTGGTIGPRAHAGRRQPLLLALALCLFMVVGVPILVLVVMPASRAEESSAPAGDTFLSDPGLRDPGSDPGTDAFVSQLDAGDTSDPALPPDLVVAAAEQVLTTTEPGTESTSGRQGSNQGSGSLPQITPNLTLLGPDLARNRQPTVTGEGDGTLSGDGGNGVPPLVSGEQVSHRTGSPEELDVGGNAAGTRSVPPGNPAGHDQDTASASLVIAPGDPTLLRVADAGFPTEGVRVRSAAGAFGPGVGVPGGEVLLVRFVGGGRRGGGADALLPESGPADGSVLVLDPVALGVDPAALAAVLAGRGPITVSPTPTSGDSLEEFLRLVVWEQRHAVLEGRQTVYNLYANRAWAPEALWDPEGYHEAARRMSPSGKLPGSPTDWNQPVVRDRTFGIDYGQAGSTSDGYYQYSRGPFVEWRGSLFPSHEPHDAPYRLYLNPVPDNAPYYLLTLVEEFVEGPRAGVPEARMVTAASIETRRNGVQVAAASLDTLEQVALRMRELGRAHYDFRLRPDMVPMAASLFPGMGVVVEPPVADLNSLRMGAGLPPEQSNHVFGVERSNVIDAALREAPAEDFDAFRRLVHEGLRAKGISPDAPHGRVDVEWFSPERFARLQADGSSTRAYNSLGGVRSPAVVGTGVGTGTGLVLTGVDIVLNPGEHPHAVRDLAVGAGTGAAGSYVGGRVEFGLNARWAPVELTAANAPLSAGLSRMVLPRAGSGGVSGVLTAPLMTWTVMGANEVFFGAEYTGGDYVALPTRAAVGGGVGGGVGAGTGALATYLLGGAAAGWEVPVMGSLLGMLGGLIAYHVADWLWGDRIERSVRGMAGEKGPEKGPESRAARR